MHKPLTRRSFFRRFLFSYVLILLIPVLTICLTYSAANRSIRDEIVRSNNNSLRQFAGIADSRLSTMAATVKEVLTNSTVRDFANVFSDTEGNYGYKAWQVNAFLSNLPIADFSDLFVYFMRSEHIISAYKAGLSSDMYMDVYYNYTPGNPEPDWSRTALLTLGTPNVPVLTVLKPNARERHLALLYAQNSGFVRAHSNLVACAVLLPDQLNEMLASAQYHSESVIGIMDPSGAAVVSSGTFPDPFDAGILSGDGGLEETEDYVYQTLPSKVVNSWYVVATPRSVFWERLNSLRIISFGSLLLCLLVSAYFAILLARRNYLPIHSVLDTIYSKTRQLPANEDGNEMEFIHHVLARSLDENDALISRVENETNTLRDDFLLRALAGTWIEHAEEDTFDTVGISLLSDRFGVVLLHVDHLCKGEKPLEMDTAMQRKLTAALGDLFLQQAPERHHKYLVALSPTVYAGIVNFAKDTEQEAYREELLHLCGGWAAAIRAECGCVCTLAIGRIRTGLAGIHAAYGQAQLAMQYRYLFGAGSIIRHEDISDRIFQFDHASASRASHLMLCHVQGEGGDVNEVIRQVIACSPIDDSVSMDTVECFKYDLIGGLNRILHETGTMRLEKENRLIHGLISAETMQAFWTLLADTLEKLRLFAGENKAHFTVCDRAAEYVRQHFADATLNNTGIGEALAISPSYLAKLFKDQRGISLSDDLAQVRIRHAKKLLTGSHKTLEEIAGESGFLSSGTFIKSFKKLEGVTPGAFRKLSAPQEGPDEGSGTGVA